MRPTSLPTDPAEIQRERHLVLAELIEGHDNEVPETEYVPRYFAFIFPADGSPQCIEQEDSLMELTAIIYAKHQFSHIEIYNLDA